MTEVEEHIQALEKELVRTQSCVRLSQNSDFLVFRDMMDKKLAEYRTMLEERAEDERSNIVRGGILALKDMFNLFDNVGNREKEIISSLKELKNENN